MRQTQLPAFSKDLKLTFHINQQNPNSNYEIRGKDHLDSANQQSASASVFISFMMQVAGMWSLDIML